jgi:hypothetical protein
VAASVLAAQPPVEVLARRVAGVRPPQKWRRISRGFPSGIGGVSRKPRRVRHRRLASAAGDMKGRGERRIIIVFIKAPHLDQIETMNRDPN